MYPFITWRKFVEETRLTRLEINFSNKKKIQSKLNFNQRFVKHLASKYGFLQAFCFNFMCK